MLDKIFDGFTVTVHNLGQKYVGKGKTAYDAVMDLDVKNAKGKSVVVIERGGKKKEIVLAPQMSYRLFHTRGLTREATVRSFTNGFRDL